jgi:hypothetical protein
MIYSEEKANMLESLAGKQVKNCSVRCSRNDAKGRRGHLMQSAKPDDNGEQSGPIPITQTPVVRKATGPRTELGKQRSKHNASKHGDQREHSRNFWSISLLLFRGAFDDQ